MLRSRRSSSAIALAALLFSACGADAGTEVRQVPEFPGAEVGGITVEAGPSRPLPEPSAEPGSAPTVEERALTASKEMVAGFIERLASNDIEGAAALSTGPAAQFLLFLQESSRCGLAFSGGRSQPPVRAEVVSPGLFAIEAEATLSLASGPTRLIEAFAVAELKDGSWRIHDFLTLDMSTADLLPRFGSAERDDLSLTMVNLCAGPDRIEVTYEVSNQSRHPMTVTELAFAGADGRTVPVEFASDQVLAPIPGRTGGITWELSIATPEAFKGGALLVRSVDSDETAQEGREVVVERDYELVPSPFLGEG